MSGYIGTQPVPQATQTRDSFTCAAGQTSFATGGYTPTFLDVYLNGVHLLNGTDYTATNGSDVVLTTGAAAGDVLEVVSYSTYEVNSQNYTGGLTVDNDGATVLTVDRATSDGTIIDVQKNGTTVGSIGVHSSSVLYAGTGDTGIAFQPAFDVVIPFNPSTNDNRDNAVSLGANYSRFKDLYLSGGVYLGGTGSANKLDDYEEGTWTPTVGSGSITAYKTVYTKVGRLVHVTASITFSGTGTAGLSAVIDNLPFTILTGSAPAGVVRYQTAFGAFTIHGNDSLNSMQLYALGGSPVTYGTLGSARLDFSMVYETA